jgi:short-subunit dehydrogenase
MPTFQGCTALITGASAGLGREFARQLAPRAQVLILVARRADRLEELRAELARPGLAIHCHAFDLADPAKLETLLAVLASGPDEIDLLINNAGVGDHGLFERSEWPRIQAMLDVNIRALTHLTHALLPRLVRSGRGAILNVSSIAALMPIPQMAVYAATKAYVSSFTEALRAELRGTGVTVTALCPGPIDTEFFERAERPGARSGVMTPSIFKIPAEQAVREALEAAGANRARVIAGWPVWVAMTLVALIPIALLRLFLPGRERSRF